MFLSRNIIFSSFFICEIIVTTLSNQNTFRTWNITITENEMNDYNINLLFFARLSVAQIITRSGCDHTVSGFNTGDRSQRGDGIVKFFIPYREKLQQPNRFILTSVNNL